jgi:hypothetical protein
MEYCNMDTVADLPEKHASERYFGVYTFDNDADNYPIPHPLYKEDAPKNELILLPDIAKGILFHVLYAFYFLHNKISFGHGDAKIANVFLHKYKTDTIVIWPTSQGVKQVISPFCAKLADYGKSSATFISQNGEATRIFYEPTSSREKLFRDTQKIINPFVPKVSNDTYTVSSNLEATVYNRLRTMGIPYYKSYDVYMFLISFFLQPSNFYILSVYPKFKTYVWDIMWKHSPESGVKVYRRIVKKIAKNYGSKELFRTGILISMLKDITLNCNITKILLDSLSMYDP